MKYLGWLKKKSNEKFYEHVTPSYYSMLKSWNDMEHIKRLQWISVVGLGYQNAPPEYCLRAVSGVGYKRRAPLLRWLYKPWSKSTGPSIFVHCGFPVFPVNFFGDASFFSFRVFFLPASVVEDSLLRPVRSTPTPSLLPSAHRVYTSESTNLPSVVSSESANLQICSHRFTECRPPDLQTSQVEWAANLQTSQV